MSNIEQVDRGVSYPMGILGSDLLAQIGGAERASLANTTKCASTVYHSQIPQPVLDAKKHRYALQQAARELLPNERIRQCHRDTIPGANEVEIVYNETTGAYFKNVFCCGSVWSCPVCAAKISEKRRKELTMLLVGQPYRIVMVTYKLRHHKWHKLANLIETLKDTLRDFKGGREFQAIKEFAGWSGSINSSEITWGKENGWHPHVHELVLVNQTITDAQLVTLEDMLKRRWLAALARNGADATYENGLTLSTQETDVHDYIEKYGHEPALMTWTPEHELTKAVNKQGHKDGLTPMQLLDAYRQGDQDKGKLFVEYFAAMKGKQQVIYSKGLKEKLGLTALDMSDEEIAQELPEGETLVKLDRDVRWRYILKQERRAELLEVASLGDRGLIEIYFAAIGMPAEKTVIDFTDWNSEGGKPPPLPDKPVFGVTLPQGGKR